MESLDQALAVLDQVARDGPRRRGRYSRSSGGVAASRETSGDQAEPRQGDDRRSGRKGRGAGRGGSRAGRSREQAEREHVREGRSPGNEQEAGEHLDDVDDGRRLAVRGRRGAGGAKRRASKTLNRRDRRFSLHSEFLNRSGRARTADHLITAPGMKPAPVKGSAKWKVWTPAAILRAGFAQEAAAQRDIAHQIDGAGHTNSGTSRFVISSCVLGHQAASLKELRALGKQRPLLFYVRSIMWDETTFDLKWEQGGPPVSHSILCSHAQVAYRVSEDEDVTVRDVPPLHGPGIRDQHVVRVPQVLPRYNAETIWQALGRFSGGLHDSASAQFSATLSSCDAHRANLKVLRKLHCRLPERHLLLINLCAQHRAANCVEALTKAVGNLTGVFCLSKVFNYRNVLVHLRKHVSKRLEQVADRVRERPLGNLREWQKAAACAGDLVRLCKDCMEPPTSGKKHPLDRLADFFQGPWTGPSGREEGYRQYRALV